MIRGKSAWSPFVRFCQTSTKAPHTPVLLHETLQGMKLGSNPVVIDGTFGAGGHTSALLELHSDCTVYCIDQDASVFESDRFTSLKTRYGDRIQACEGNFRNMRKVTNLPDSSVDGILLDLGMSSMQVDSSRGFSFRPEFNGDLDMRMSPTTQTLTAKEIVNNYTEAHLAHIFHKLGEELAARRVAQGIVSYREKKPIETTQELVNIVMKYVRQSRINPATKVFQALRIYINDEINALADGIMETEKILKPGGRAAFLSYHSLEDKMIKYFTKYASGVRIKDCVLDKPTFSLPHKKVIKPSKAEVKDNMRARSAKLRIIERTREKECCGETFFNEVFQLKLTWQC